VIPIRGQDSASIDDRCMIDSITPRFSDEMPPQSEDREITNCGQTNEGEEEKGGYTKSSNMSRPMVELIKFFRFGVVGFYAEDAFTNFITNFPKSIIKYPKI
jgi:hypothetical protein